MTHSRCVTVHLRLILPRGRRTGAISTKCAIFGRISRKCCCTCALFCHFRLTCVILCPIGGKVAEYSASAPRHGETSRKWGARAWRPPDNGQVKVLDWAFWRSTSHYIRAQKWVRQPGWVTQFEQRLDNGKNLALDWMTLNLDGCHTIRMRASCRHLGQVIPEPDGHEMTPELGVVTLVY